MVEDIIRTLNASQRRVVLSLSERPCLLGCSAATASRLARPTSRRPALVVESPGSLFREHALNADGLAVQAALRKQRAA